MEHYWKELLEDWKCPNRLLKFDNTHASVKDPFVCNIHEDSSIIRCKMVLDSTRCALIAKAAQACHVSMAAFCHAAFAVAYAGIVESTVVQSDSHMSSRDGSNGNGNGNGSGSGKTGESELKQVSGTGYESETEELDREGNKKYMKSQKDIVYGLTSSGRCSGLVSIHAVVGPVINTFPIRMQFPANDQRTAKEVVEALSAQINQSIEHESLPLAQIMRQAKQCVGKPLFNAIFDYQQGAWDQELSEGVSLTDSQLIDNVATPLTIRVIHEKTSASTADKSISTVHTMQLHATSENVTVDATYLKEFLSTFSRNLGNMAENINIAISELMPRVAPAEPVALAVELSPTLLMHDKFVDLLMTPSASASSVISYDAQGERHGISYMELNSMSLRIAKILACEIKDSNKSKVVTVVMEKGWEQVVAVLAIHRAQCAYLPVDARLWPEHRIRQVLELSESCAIITQSHLLEPEMPNSQAWLTGVDIPVILVDARVSTGDWKLCSRTVSTGQSKKKKSVLSGITEMFGFGTSPKALDALKADFMANIDTSLDGMHRARPRDLAYLIYTSGSTGIPKGVCCHHQGAMNTIDFLNERFSIGAKDRVLAISSLAFDLSVYDIFGLLSVGGGVVIPPPGSVNPPDPGIWLDLVVREGVTVWNSVPAIVDLLVSHAEYSGEMLPESLRLFFMSGDWIPPSLPARIRAVCRCPDVQIIAMGGATEAAIWSNMYELGASGSGLPAGWNSVPYGRPMRNQSMLILDDKMEHCEVWVTGGIYIGGAGVASGYFRNEERTAYQFVKHPVTGEALFRTGDLGRLRPDGLLEILGREDSQVKVNGFRIELGEIERVIKQHKDVQAAAVTVHKNALCAYLVMAPGWTGASSPEAASLLYEAVRNHCKITVAEYMVPHHYMIITEIPLSSNGKVQRDRLPVIRSVSVGAERSYSFDTSCVSYGASNMFEELIADVWGEVLGVDPNTISLEANFFSLGGDSLLCVQVVARLRRKGYVLTVPRIFENPTISKLAIVISKSDHQGKNATRSAMPEVLGTSSEEVALKPVFEIDPEALARGGVQDQPGIDSPYPLIGINQAHFVGLFTSQYSSQGLAPQIYFEWHIGTEGPVEEREQVNIERLEYAFTAFIARHITFRSFITQDGSMQAISQLPQYKLTKVNFLEENNGNDPNGAFEIADKKRLKDRTEMLTMGIDVFKWPLFDCRVTHLSPTSSCIHISVSLFLMDAMSDLIFRQELSALYRAGPSVPIVDVLPAPAKLLFKDYCVALAEKLPKSDLYQRARQYWHGRLKSLSAGPELPLIINTNGGEMVKVVTNSSDSSPHVAFVNQHRWLTVQEWNRAKANCAYHAVTVPAMLLAVYSIMLSRFSTRDKFLLNILQCLRHQVHEDVNKLVGNCSSTILCDVDLSAPLEQTGLSFKIAVLRLSLELSRNLEHSSMSGVEVMQELNRLEGRTFQAVAPFIFTTPIGAEKGNIQVKSRNWMFQETFFSEKVPHTACVNAIKADPNGTACASLDIIENVFPAGTCFICMYL